MRTDGGRSAPAGRLVIISGPSGSGKSTVVRRVLEECPVPLTLSVSATTRDPRPGECDGHDYLFLTPERFAQLREDGEFLECKEVFGRGYWYGTLRQTVASGLNAGKWVILEIDVEGAIAVMEQGFEPITIFLHPGDMAELERRLRGRGTESEQAIARRLEVAEHEMQFLPQYQHEVINSTVDDAVQQICQILAEQKESSECSTN